MHNGYVCMICGGNCDAGELVNGVCHECRNVLKQNHNEETKCNKGEPKSDEENKDL